jgi:hypothetical protein
MVVGIWLWVLRLLVLLLVIGVGSCWFVSPTPYQDIQHQHIEKHIETKEQHHQQTNNTMTGG